MNSLVVLISEEDVYFQNCVDKIRFNLRKSGFINSTERMEYISVILKGCISIVTKSITYKLFLSELLPGGISDTSGYIIYADGILICITAVNMCEDNSFVQNITLCERAYKYNQEIKKERYLYGIITTATVWYFLRYKPDSICRSGPYPINLWEKKSARLDVKNIMQIIVALLKDK